MRKKIVIFLIVLAIVCGIMVGVKNVKIEPSETNYEIVKNDVVPEIYRDELNLFLSEVDTLNPLRTKNSQLASILNLIYEPLIRYESDESIEPILAKEWSKLDSYTWIIRIRDDIKWHNGVSFSIDDVFFTFNILLNNNSVYSSNLSNIKTIEKLDEKSLKIVLNVEDDYFINKLFFPILPEHYFKDNYFNDDVRASNPIGTGAYKYFNNTEDGKIVLVFNNSWWKEKNAKLQKIYLYLYETYGEAIKAFKSSEIDVIATNMSDWKDRFGTIGLNFYSFENSEYEVIIPNCNNIALAENSVRRAILQAINRENIINSIYNDNASISDIPIHTNSKNSITNAEYDIEKAKQILINAGWRQGENIWSKEIDDKTYNLNFTLLVNKESKEKLLVAEKIKSNLSEIGINITIKEISMDKLKDNIANDKFDLALVSLDIKNEVSIQDNVSKENELNYANYNSDEMEKIIDKLRIDNESYNQNMYAFAQFYKNDAPYIGLYFKTSTILTNKSVKGNFEPTWSNYYRNITSFCK